LKPGGKVLLFEHGWDAHNYAIFGPVIHHVTKRQDWDKFLRDRFDDVKYARSSQAVDLFVGTRRRRILMGTQSADADVIVIGGESRELRRLSA